MGIIRDSFVIFSQWDDAIRKAPEDVQLKLYHALMDFAKTGEMPNNLDWQVDMLLTSIQKDMKQNIDRYFASVENGKKGGRPKNLEKPSETQENLDEPSETQPEKLKNQKNLDEPNLTHYVNVNVNDISQSINKNISINAHARVRDELSEKFKESALYVFDDEKRAFNEIVDVLAEAIIQTQTEEGLVFNRQVIPVGYFNNLDFWQIKKIIPQLIDNPNIENRNYYILGALINRVREMKE